MVGTKTQRENFSSSNLGQQNAHWFNNSCLFCHLVAVFVSGFALWYQIPRRTGGGCGTRQRAGRAMAGKYRQKNSHHNPVVAGGGGLAVMGHVQPDIAGILALRWVCALATNDLCSVEFMTKKTGPMALIKFRDNSL